MKQFNHTQPARTATRFAAMLLVVAMLTSTASLASATTKSPREDVPTGAHVLYWNDPLIMVGGSLARQVTVTNLAVIVRVRALIDALPVSNNAHRVCPDDMMMPITLSFASHKGAVPFTRVVFQLRRVPERRGLPERRGGSSHFGRTHTLQHLCDDSTSGRPQFRLELTRGGSSPVRASLRRVR